MKTITVKSNRKNNSVFKKPSDFKESKDINPVTKEKFKREESEPKDIFDKK